MLKLWCGGSGAGGGSGAARTIEVHTRQTCKALSEIVQLTDAYALPHTHTQRHTYTHSRTIRELRKVLTIAVQG